MKKLFSIIILSTISLTNINSAFSISPDVFIQSTVNRASQLLSKDISKDEKMSQLKQIAKETVDIRGIGFYSLGSARKNLTENQKKTYSDLFEKYFLKSFSSRLSEWTDPEINVISQNIINKKYTIGTAPKTIGVTAVTLDEDELKLVTNLGIDIGSDFHYYDPYPNYEIIGQSSYSFINILLGFIKVVVLENT